LNYFSFFACGPINAGKPPPSMRATGINMIGAAPPLTQQDSYGHETHAILFLLKTLKHLLL
jgi:hypothetical protein